MTSFSQRNSPPLFFCEKQHGGGDVEQGKGFGRGGKEQSNTYHNLDKYYQQELEEAGDCQSLCTNHHQRYSPHLLTIEKHWFSAGLQYSHLLLEGVSSWLLEIPLNHCKNIARFLKLMKFIRSDLQKVGREEEKWLVLCWVRQVSENKKKQKKKHNYCLILCAFACSLFFGVSFCGFCVFESFSQISEKYLVRMDLFFALFWGKKRQRTVASICPGVCEVHVGNKVIFFFSLFWIIFLIFFAAERLPPPTTCPDNHCSPLSTNPSKQQTTTQPIPPYPMIQVFHFITSWEFWTLPCLFSPLLQPSSERWVLSVCAVLSSFLNIC